MKYALNLWVSQTAGKFFTAWVGIGTKKLKNLSKTWGPKPTDTNSVNTNGCPVLN